MEIEHTPPPERLVTLRQKHQGAVRAAIGMAMGSTGIGDELTIVGLRHNFRLSFITHDQKLECACKVSETSYFQSLEQLAPIARTAFEKNPLPMPLPAAASDPIESSDFWMTMVDQLSDFANFLFIQAKTDIQGMAEFLPLALRAAKAEKIPFAPGLKGFGFGLTDGD